MAKLHKIKFPRTPAYDLEDQSALHFLGHTSTVLTDGSTTATITIGGQSVTAVANDYVTANVNNNNFIFNGTSWTCIDSIAGGFTPDADQLAAINSGIDSTKVGQIATNQTNISSVEDMICDTEFSTSTAYAIGDIVTYNNSLYEFTSAHSAGAWNSADVTQIDVVGIIGNINTVLEGVL